MKKQLLKTMLVTMALVFGASWAWAADPDLENDYTLVKSVTWGDGTNIAGSGACAYTAYDTGNKKQQTLTILTAPEDAAGWIAMQAWTDGSGKGWWNRADKGLYCVNAGRSAAVFGDDLTTGWLVVFECTTSASSVMTLTNGAGDPDGTFSYVASEDGQKYFCTITAAENAYVGFCGNKNNGFISKISVYKPNKTVVLTTYTVNYVDMDGNTLKEPATYDAIAGADITLSDADKANIVVGDDTYVYDSDDTEGKTVAEDGSSVVTVKFHKAQNFNYIVNEMCGGTAARVTKSFSYETAKVTAPYRKYNAVNGQLYTKGATDKEYNYKFSLTEDNQVENLDYEAVEGTTNVVFLTEGEDVVGLTPCNSANTGIRSSNSASAYAKNDTKIAVLGPGTYKLHAIIYDASKNPDSHWIFKAGETQIADFNCTTVNIQEFDSEEFTVAETCNLIMAAAGSNTMGLDALYITGDGEVTAPEDAYTLVGNCAAIFGTEWDVTNTANDMVKGEDGIYTKTYEGVELTNDYVVEYKVVKNYAYDNGQWPNGSDNAYYTVWEGDGKYDVTFTFDLANNRVSCDMKKCVEEVTDVYTIAGTKDLTGYEWDATQNEMTLNAVTGLYEWSAENVKVTTEIRPEFKIVKNGTEWYPENNWVITPWTFAVNGYSVYGREGIYDIYITFNPETKEITVEGSQTQQTIYTVAGAFKDSEGKETASVFGTMWDCENTSNDLEFDSRENLSLSKNADLEVGTILFKVVKEHSWDINYGQDGVRGGANVEIPVEKAGSYTITFVFVPDFWGDGARIGCSLEYHDPTTGISAISVAAQQGQVFNMAGQRVMNTQKGLYIVNGKKVMK